MQAFEYASPATLQEAFSLLGKRWGDIAVLAGGTDLLDTMKDYVETPRRVVNIKGIKELEGLQKTGGGLRIGALVTLDELLHSAEVKTDYPALAEAARGVSSMQMRNMGTVVGDLCQRPRCWYFRLGYGLLPKGPNGEDMVADGDNRYHAIFNNKGPAKFVSASSFGPALVALGAKVKIASAAGTRELPIEKFFVIPQAEGQREIALQPNEIVTEILVPPPAGRNATYEVRQKEALDLPLATAAVALEMKGAAIGKANIVLGHVAPVPYRATAAEKTAMGKTIGPATAEAIAKAAVAGATPLSGNAYKVQLARVAVKRALLETAKAKA